MARLVVTNLPPRRIFPFLLYILGFRQAFLLQSSQYFNNFKYLGHIPWLGKNLIILSILVPQLFVGFEARNMSVKIVMGQSAHWAEVFRHFKRPGRFWSLFLATMLKTIIAVILPELALIVALLPLLMHSLTGGNVIASNPLPPNVDGPDPLASSGRAYPPSGAKRYRLDRSRASNKRAHAHCAIASFDGNLSQSALHRRDPSLDCGRSR